MDYKLEYMTRLFAKISKKKTETYVINLNSATPFKKNNLKY